MGYTVAIEDSKDVEKALEHIAEVGKVKNTTAYNMFLNELLKSFGEGTISLEASYDGKLKLNSNADEYNPWEKTFCTNHNINSLQTYLGVHPKATIVKFGAGSARKKSGEPTVSTAQQEVLTGVFILLEMSKKDVDLMIKKKDFDLFKQYLNKVVIHRQKTAGLEANTLWDIVLTNAGKWTDSFKLAANKFKQTFGQRADYVFYFGDAGGPLKVIYDTARARYKDANFTADVNKWSPADIWFMDATGKKIAEGITKAKSIYELNDILRKAIVDKHIIPVSLKKCVGSASIKEVNFEQDKNKKTTFPYDATDITDVTFSKLGEKTFYSFAGGQIKFKIKHDKNSAQQTMSARNSQKTTGFTIEINGQNARDGQTNIKALHGIIKNVTGATSTLEADYKKIHEAFGLKTVNGNAVKVDHNREAVYEFYQKVIELKKLAGTHKIMTESEERDSKFLQYVALLESANPKGSHDVINLPAKFEDFYKHFIELNLAWKTAKWLMVEVMWNVLKHSSGDKAVKEIIYQLYRLASSQHEVSAPFYKIS